MRAGLAPVCVNAATMAMALVDGGASRERNRQGVTMAKAQTSALDNKQLPAEQLEALYTTMRRIRAFEQRATDLFNEWGLGDPDVGNGLLVMLVKNKRRLEVVTGSKGHTRSE